MLAACLHTLGWQIHPVCRESRLTGSQSGAKEKVSKDGRPRCGNDKAREGEGNDQRNQHPRTILISDNRQTKDRLTSVCFLPANTSHHCPTGNIHTYILYLYCTLFFVSFSLSYAQVLWLFSSCLVCVVVVFGGRLFCMPLFL